MVDGHSTVGLWASFAGGSYTHLGQWERIHERLRILREMREIVRWEKW